MIVVKETAVAAERKSSRHSQEDSDEGNHQGSEESDDETVQVICYSSVVASEIIQLNLLFNVFFCNCMSHITNENAKRL